jgi:hypothetical protein
MALNHDLNRCISHSVQPILSAALLIVFAGVLAACHAPAPPDEDQRMFVAVDLPPLTSDRASTGGVSFADFDSDGDADLFITNGYDVSSPDPAPQTNRFYENAQGRYVARTIDGLTDLDGFSSGSTWADFDNDGDLDTFIANQRDQENVILLQEAAEDGSVRFVGHSTSLLAEDKGWSYSVAAADADNDGFVDIYVSNGGLSHQGVNFLYQNIEGMRLRRVLDTDSVNSAHASGEIWTASSCRSFVMMVI